jgi:hypothetical protein
MTESIAELARAAKDETVRTLSEDYFEVVYGGCPTATCTAGQCIDDYEDGPDTCW